MKSWWYLAVALALSAVVGLGMRGLLVDQIKADCDTYGAVKLGHDVYECKKERGVE